jgi:sugar phosphate permease
MLAAMLVAGIGSSTVHPTGYPLITANVSAANKGRVLGMWGSASKFGDGLAPAAVGVMLIALPWTAIVGAFGALAVLFTLGLFVVLATFETEPVDSAGDAPAGTADSADDARAGTADSAGGTADSAAGSAGPETPRTDKRRYRYPMIAIFVYFTVQIMAANGVTVFLPEFIASTYGFTVSALGTSLTTESTASFYYSVLLLVAGVAQLGTGELADRFDYRRLIIGYLLVATVALSSLSLLPLSPVGLLVVLVVLGVSLYSINPARDALVSEITPADREGRTFGYIWTGALVAASVSPPVVGYVGETAGLRTAFALLAGVVLLSTIPVAFLLHDRVYVTESQGAVKSD